MDGFAAARRRRRSGNRSAEWVGPKAVQLRDAAVKSVAIAIVFIMAYVALLRLRSAPAASSRSCDAMMVVGVFVIFKKRSASRRSPRLTIVGY
jgi:preprotein translocase subunit SecF